jgi:hypothetical protein
MTKRRSALSVARLRSATAGSGVRVVEPWPRASTERMPAEGSFLRISAVRAAKERPEEPAPWWATKRGAGPVGDVR